MELSTEAVIEGLLEEVKRLTMDVVMLRAAVKSLQEEKLGNEKGISD